MSRTIFALKAEFCYLHLSHTASTLYVPLQGILGHFHFFSCKEAASMGLKVFSILPFDKVSILWCSEGLFLIGSSQSHGFLLGSSFPTNRGPLRNCSNSTAEWPANKDLPRLHWIVDVMEQCQAKAASMPPKLSLEGAYSFTRT